MLSPGSIEAPSFMAEAIPPDTFWASTLSGSPQALRGGGGRNSPLPREISGKHFGSPLTARLSASQPDAGGRASFIRESTLSASSVSPCRAGAEIRHLEPERIRHAGSSTATLVPMVVQEPTTVSPLCAAAAELRRERAAVAHAAGGAVLGGVAAGHNGMAAASCRSASACGSDVGSPGFREDTSAARATSLSGFSPFAAHKSQLCVLAGVRHRRWGSLQSSWLAKNAFEGWRAQSCKARPVEVGGIDQGNAFFALEQRVLELESTLMERDRIITRLGQQLQAVDVKVDVDTKAIANAVLDGLSSFDMQEHLRTYHEQVLGALQSVQPKETDHSEVLHAIRSLNFDVDHGPVLEGIERLHGHAAHHGEVRGALDDLHRAVSGIQVDHGPVLSEIARLHERSDTLHGDLHRRVDMIEGLHKEHGSALEELLQVRKDVTLLREELARDIATVRAEALEAADVWRRDCGVLNSRLLEVQEAMDNKPEVNLSPIVAAVTNSRNSVLAALEASKVDLDPVMRHISGIRPIEVDHSPVLDSIRNIRVEQDMTPITQAIRESTHSILQAVNSISIEIDHSPVLDSIRRINFEADYSPVVGAVHGARRSILAAISAWEVDHSPVLDSIRGINIEADYSPILAAIRDCKSSNIAAIRSLEVDLTPVLEEMARLPRALSSSIESPDLTPVLNAVRTAEARITSAVGGAKVDLVPIIDEVHTRHSEAMQAIRRIRVDPVDLTPAISAINMAAADLERSIQKINFEVDHSEVLRAIHRMQPPDPDFSPILQALARLETDMLTSIARMEPSDITPVVTAVRSVEASVEHAIRGIQMPETDIMPVLSAVRKVDADLERSINKLRSEVLETLGELEPEQPDFSPVLRGINGLANMMTADLMPIMHELKKVEPDLSHIVHEIHRAERDLLHALQPELAAVLAGLNASEVDLGPVLRAIERNRMDEHLIARILSEVLRTEQRDHTELLEAIRQLKANLTSRPAATRVTCPAPMVAAPVATVTFPAQIRQGVPLVQQLQHYFHAWQRFAMASGQGGPHPAPVAWHHALPPASPVRASPAPPLPLAAPPGGMVWPIGSLPHPPQPVPLEPLANRIDGFLEELDHSRGLTPPTTPPHTPRAQQMTREYVEGSPVSPSRNSRPRAGHASTRSYVID